MTYPSGAVVTYLRNANGQITRVDAVPVSGGGQVTLVSDASYLPFGPLTTLTYGNGRVLTKAYDLNYGIDAVSDNAASNPLSQDFTLDALGNVTGLSERTDAGTVLSRTFTYDGLDRLTAQQNGAATVEGFAYDATGNRTSKTVGATTNYTYPSNSHRLSSVGGTARTYDANGNTTAIGTGTGARNFTFDDRNRLREVKLGTSLKATWFYNGKGERVGVLAATLPAQNSRQYAYDSAGRLLGEYTPAGVRVKEYVWLDDTLIAVLASHDGSTYQLVETDHLGTPRTVVHPAQNAIVWRWDLNTTAFGEHAPSENPDGNGLGYQLNLRFPGQYYDAESGLHYNYFRDYDPGTGRYVESDPIGLRGGTATYPYVSSNSLHSVDRRGLLTFGPNCSADQALKISDAIISLANEIQKRVENGGCDKGSCDLLLASRVLDFLAKKQCSRARHMRAEPLTLQSTFTLMLATLTENLLRRQSVGACKERSFMRCCITCTRIMES